MSLIVMFSLNVNAQYTGKGSEVEVTTIKNVIDNAYKLDKSDALVKIKGFFVEQINSDTFWFTDATGKIQVELEKKYFPQAPFNETTEVYITGKVDHDVLEQTEIEIKEVVFVK